MMWFHKTVVTVFGLGYAPKAPGTFGTLGAVLLLGLCLHFNINYSWPIQIAVILLSSLLGIISTNKVISEWGDDPSRVVIDEFAGYLLGMLLIPLSWTNILLGLILFRFFDILKPLGIRKIDDNVKGGLGVMLDDILAGVYTLICLQAINYFFNIEIWESQMFLFLNLL